MTGTQEKIQLLLKIAHRLNEAHIEWALGASMLLYFKGITSDFHDIDLMVADCDAECVHTILSEMGESCPSDSIPNPMYRTKIFMEFLIDSDEICVQYYKLENQNVDMEMTASDKLLTINIFDDGPMNPKGTHTAPGTTRNLDTVK